jgi:hypothetical protein
MGVNCQRRRLTQIRSVRFNAKNANEALKFKLRGKINHIFACITHSLDRTGQSMPSSGSEYLGNKLPR